MPNLIKNSWTDSITYLISLQELDNDELRPLSSGAPNQTSRNQNQLIWLRYFSLALYPSSVIKTKRTIWNHSMTAGIKGRTHNRWTPAGQFRTNGPQTVIPWTTDGPRMVGPKTNRPRTDVGRTWPRTPDEQTLTTAWRLPDDCLTTAWRLPDDCLTTALQVLDDCLMTKFS